MPGKQLFRSLELVLFPVIVCLLFQQGSLYSTPFSVQANRNKSKAIVQFRLTNGDKIYYADLLDGLDYSVTPPRFTDRQNAAIEVKIYSELGVDGSGKSRSSRKGKLFPDKVRINGRIRTCSEKDKTFIRTSLKVVGKGVWLKDLQAVFRQKFAICKKDPDEKLRREGLSHLYHWCGHYGLFSEREKVKRSLKGLGGLITGIDRNTGGGEPDAVSQRNAGIKTAFEALSGAGTVIVRSSKHVTVASDWMSEQTVNSLLDMGEFICREFNEIMYDQEKTAPAIPDEEILRYFAFMKTRTMAAALRNANTLSSIGNVTDENRIVGNLKSGGVTFSTRAAGKVLRTNFNCVERQMSDDPSDVKEIGHDDHDWMAHRVTHALVDNYFRENRVPGMGRSTMPWIEEGLSIYMTITHLGTYRCLCVDSPTKKTYAKGNRSRSKERKRTGIVEDDLNAIALDPYANKFEDMIRLPHYRSMKSETTAKAFSMIRFMIERDHTAFIRFVNSLQDHYRVLFENRKDVRPFLDGLDALVAGAFGQGAVENPQQVGTLRTVEELEAAWRDWASKPSFDRTIK